jgi:uncharacterized protein (DUF488 family)
MPRPTELVVTTIGVYGWTLDSFLDALRRSGVGVVVDVRQRRGVRGREYAWANARRLETSMAEAAIEYRHRADLAPSTELRRLQYTEDDRLGVGKRTRTELAPEYSRRYTGEVLDRADVERLAAELRRVSPSALLCVERDPQACHRSLIADRLAERHGATVHHLLPPS